MHTISDLTAPLELPEPNLPLLRKVLDHIDAHPEEHNQTIWGFEFAWAERAVGPLREINRLAGKCDTAMCIAGWAMALGAPDLFASRRWDSTDAQALLGIDDDEAGRLFGGSRTRGNIQRVSEQIAARAGERL